MKIHRSFIININLIDVYYYVFVIMKTGDKVAVGDKFRKGLKERLFFWGQRKRTNGKE